MSDVDTAPDAKLMERTWRWHFSESAAVGDGSASYDASKPFLSQEMTDHVFSSISPDEHQSTNAFQRNRQLAARKVWMCTGNLHLLGKYQSFRRVLRLRHPHTRDISVSVVDRYRKVRDLRPLFTRSFRDVFVVTAFCASPPFTSVSTRNAEKPACHIAEIPFGLRLWL